MTSHTPIMIHCKSALLFLWVVLCANLIQAATLNVAAIVEVFSHNEKVNYGGKPGDMIAGTGMNGNTDDNAPPTALWSWPITHPSTWTVTSNSYKDEWQSGDLLDSGTSTNSKIGWAIFDLGSAHNLDTFYIWNARENNTRYTKTFNVYIASSPTVAPSHGPTNNTSIDYDFSSGGWTLINTGGSLAGTHQGNQSLVLQGNLARYIAVEILSNNGDGNRVGLAEVGITFIPAKGTLFRID